MVNGFAPLSLANSKSVVLSEEVSWEVPLVETILKPQVFSKLVLFCRFFVANVGMTNPPCLPDTQIPGPVPVFRRRRTLGLGAGGLSPSNAPTPHSAHPDLALPQMWTPAFLATFG
jgi:hypothetical protein